MNSRHLNEDERRALRRMADEARLVEMIRAIAGMVANDHPDLHEGIEARQGLNKEESHPRQCPEDPLQPQARHG